MPVTAKLSRRFYEKFGDELTNELVEWFNQVDATYRSDLRELNELNFARFDAKLEQRLAEVKADLREEIADLRSELRTGLAALDSRLDAKIAGLEGRLVGRIGVLEGRFGTLEGRLFRWMFVYWAVALGTLIAVLKL